MIQLRHIDKSFGTLKVLQDINLTIGRGQVVSLIGPSGSGKSTLLRTIPFLEQPDHGEVWIDQQCMTGHNCTELRQHMGMVFQMFHLFPHKTVLQNLTLAPLKVKKWTVPQAEAAAETLLKRVELWDKASSYPSQLSGGQKQRVAIARALMMQPDIMLFDEPTSALDPSMVQEVLSVMLDLVAEKMTMLIVSHEMSFVKKVSDEVIFLSGGQLIEQGNVAQIFDQPQHVLTQTFIRTILP